MRAWLLFDKNDKAVAFYSRFCFDLYLFALIFFSWIQLLYVHHWASVTKKGETGWLPLSGGERRQREKQRHGGEGVFLDVEGWMLIPTTSCH